MVNVQRLKEEGLVTIPYPGNVRLLVERSIRSWKTFCDLDQSVKSGLTLGDRKSDIGYSLRDGTGQAADHKEFFHSTPKTLDQLIHKSTKIDNRSATAFIGDVETLTSGTVKLIYDLSKKIEQTFAIESLADEVMDAVDDWTLRYIHYFGGVHAAEQTAHAHVDRSGFTLHLYESAPGLEYLDLKDDPDERTWQPMPMEEGETVVIPGLSLQFRSKCELTALCHRVVATEETATSGRYSMVCFIPLTKTARYDVDNAPRLQELKPGFNYGMRFAELDPYFEAR